MLLYWLIPGIVMYIGDLVIRAWRSRVPTQLVSIVRDEATNVLLYFSIYLLSLLIYCINALD